MRKTTVKSSNGAHIPVYIGIDVGTQGTKALAYRLASDETTSDGGEILARASASYSLLPTQVQGRAEQDPQDWIDAVKHVLTQLVSDLHLVAPVVLEESEAQEDTADGDGDGGETEKEPATKKQKSTDLSTEETKYILSGIGISGQQHGMVLLDANYKPLRPAKLWCDVEASKECSWIRSQTTGSGGDYKWTHIVPGFTSPKVRWTILHEPHIWEQVRWCVLPHDYINLVLRGAHDSKNEETNDFLQPTTDRGDASGSGIYNPKTDTYDMELVNAIDPSGRYANSLPKILGPLKICGTLSKKWINDIGLSLSSSDDSTPHIPISVGTGDNMASALGSGCVRPGMAVVSLGTSGTLFGVSLTPPTHSTSNDGDGGGSSVSPFADATGRYLPLVCIMSCTGVLNSVLESFFNGGQDGNYGRMDSMSSGGGSDSSKDNVRWTHDRASELAMQHPPGCHGITFLPYLTPGERTPDYPHATGAILGLTASNMSKATSSTESVSTTSNNGNVPSNPANPMAGILYRAAMEGITYLLADGLNAMAQSCVSDDKINKGSERNGDEEKGGFQPSSLLVVGGGAHNKLWRQMLSDVIGLELRFPKEKESAALGAAFQIGAAVEAARRKGEDFSMEGRRFFYGRFCVAAEH